MPKRKRYQVKTACPQCGCSAVANLSKEEIQRRFGHVPNVELECHECFAKFADEMENVCPEWDAECQEEAEKPK